MLEERYFSDGWMDGLIDQSTDGWMDRWMDDLQFYNFHNSITVISG